MCVLCQKISKQSKNKFTGNFACSSAAAVSVCGVAKLCALMLNTEDGTWDGASASSSLVCVKVLRAKQTTNGEN